MSICAENITWKAGKKVIVNNVSLRVSRGETVGLLGPNGCGKSTLLRVLAGLRRPDAGRVTLDGQDITRMSAAQLTSLRRRRIGFVFQSYHLFPELTAWENAVLPALHWGHDREAAYRNARQWLHAFGLDDRLQHRPRELSGGEQQRVAFCRALANQPALLLADEPTGNLDPATSDQVFGVLMEVVRETGLSALIATHNMELAGRMDRVVRLG